MLSLFKSRKFWLAVFGVVQVVVLHYFNVPEEIWQSIAARPGWCPVLILGSIAVGGCLVKNSNSNGHFV